jgi:hypothetical protein
VLIRPLCVARDEMIVVEVPSAIRPGGGGGGGGSGAPTGSVPPILATVTWAPGIGSPVPARVTAPSMLPFATGCWTGDADIVRNRSARQAPAAASLIRVPLEKNNHT